MADLEPEQVELFTRLVEAARGVPRAEREEFMLLRSFGGDELQGNGLEQKVLNEDVIVLDDAGLIRVTGHHRSGSGFNFIIPPEGYSYYDDLKRSGGQPAPPETRRSPDP